MRRLLTFMMTGILLGLLGAHFLFSVPAVRAARTRSISSVADTPFVFNGTVNVTGEILDMTGAATSRSFDFLMTNDDATNTIYVAFGETNLANVDSNDWHLQAGETLGITISNRFVGVKAAAATPAARILAPN